MLDLPGIGSFYVASAPLAGVSDAAYLRILHELGTPLLFSEMCSADSLIRQRARAFKRLRLNPDIHPVVVQLFGHSAPLLAEAASIVWTEGACMVDINMGCPAKKVVKSGNGAALMDDPVRAFAIMEAVRNAVPCPVSVKLRLGLIPGKPVVMDFARRAQDVGLDFISVHGRYRSNYSMPADWTIIQQITRNLSIPVIGNGDIFTPVTAGDRIAQSGCAAVMVGRGILGNPWLPGQIDAYLKTGTVPEPVSLEDRLKVMIRHLHYLVGISSPRHAPVIFRKHAAWYLKGIHSPAHLKKKMFAFTEVKEYESLADQMIHTLQSRPDSNSSRNVIPVK